MILWSNNQKVIQINKSHKIKSSKYPKYENKCDSSDGLLYCPYLYRCVVLYLANSPAVVTAIQLFQ